MISALLSLEPLQIVGIVLGLCAVCVALPWAWMVWDWGLVRRSFGFW